MSDCEGREYKGDNVLKFTIDEASDPLAPNKPKRYGESVNGEGPMCIQLWDLNDGCVQAKLANAIAPGCTKVPPIGILEGGGGGGGGGGVSLEAPAVEESADDRSVFTEPFVLREGTFDGKSNVDIILEKEDGTQRGVSLLELSNDRGPLDAGGY